MARLFWIPCFVILVFHTGMIYGQDLPYGLHKLPSFINTPLSDEIGPIWTWDEKRMYFTRIKDPKFNKTLIYNDKDLYKSLPYGEYALFISNLFADLGDKEQRDKIYLSPFNQDVFVAEMTNGVFDRLVHPQHPLNNALPNSVCALMPDQKTLVLMNQFYQNGSMYKGFSTSTRIGEDTFTWPEPLFIYDFKELAGTDANLTLSKNGEVMILAFDRHKKENTDLHVCFRVNNNTYTEPIPLTNLNSSFREFSPALSKDGKFLFFSSTRGEYPFRSNIYVSQRLDESYTRWSKPQKLIAPVNSAFNDGHPFILGKKLYFSSDRDGSWDIFYFDFDEYAKQQELSPPVATIQKEIPKTTTRSQPEAVEEIKKPEINSIRIRVVDSQSAKPLKASVLKIEDDGQTKLRFDVDENGFLMKIEDKKVTTFYPQLNGYITKPRKYDIEAILENAEQIPILNIPVDAIKVNNSIEMEPIFFKRATNRILEISYGEIRRLAGILKTHPQIDILIKGHTDNFGDLEALIALSEKRAFAVKQFLLSQGIKPERIEIKGMGPAEPITDNSNEEEKAKNRRVEIIISKVNEL